MAIKQEKKILVLKACVQRHTLLQIAHRDFIELWNAQTKLYHVSTEKHWQPYIATFQCKLQFVLTQRNTFMGFLLPKHAVKCMTCGHMTIWLISQFDDSICSNMQLTNFNLLFFRASLMNSNVHGLIIQSEVEGRWYNVYNHSLQHSVTWKGFEKFCGPKGPYVNRLLRRPWMQILPKLRKHSL